MKIILTSPNAASPQVSMRGKTMRELSSDNKNVRKSNQRMNYPI
jgi:hypothetical protein